MLSEKYIPSAIFDRFKPGRRARATLTAVSFCLLTSLAQIAHAGTIQGRVLGQNGAPRAHARIDLSGPAQLTATSNASGQYRITAPGGTYRARISHQNRRHEEFVTIPASGRQAHDFRVSW